MCMRKNPGKIAISKCFYGGWGKIRVKSFFDFVNAEFVNARVHVQNSILEFRVKSIWSEDHLFVIRIQFAEQLSRRRSVTHEYRYLTEFYYKM